MMITRQIRHGKTLAATLGLCAALTAGTALVALAQQGDKKEQSKDEPKTVVANPIPGSGSADASGEAPDGAKLPILARSMIGVVIEDLKIGDGKEANPNSTVTINYHGTRATDGKVFDTTRGKSPATFPLRNLIQGWQLGIPGMKVGGIRVLRISYQLAYGDRSPSPDIPPKSDLVFSIELKDVK